MSGFGLFDPFVEGSGILNGLILIGDCDTGDGGCLPLFEESFDWGADLISSALASFAFLNPLVECCRSLNELTLGASCDTRDGPVPVVEESSSCIVGLILWSVGCLPLVAPFVQRGGFRGDFWSDGVCDTGYIR